jgi:endoglucanase
MAFPGRITSAEGDIEIWWPSNGAPVEGVQPFKAILSGKSVEEYYLFWQVDDGNYVWMDNSYQDYPHKEAKVDVSGWNWKPDGTYRITFIAQDLSGREITKKSTTIKREVSSAEDVQESPQPEPVDTAVPGVTEPEVPVEKPAPELVPEVIEEDAPTSSVVGQKLYANQSSSALAQAEAWKASRPDDARILARLANEGSAAWLGGWNSDVEGDVRRITEAAASQDAIATLVAYNIPNRDCGSYSAGGVSSRDAYVSWIRKIAAGISDRKAIVILEPDALAGIGCLSESAQNDRYQMISSAVDILSAQKNTKVYVDAGHAEWISADEMAGRLKKAGVDRAAGFSLNVSNFVTTDKNVSYGNSLSSKIGDAHFVVDTSRNGSGSNGEWCNPSGRSLGQRPTLSTGHDRIDAFLWVKTPGESDGSCNGGPSAGTWWPEYALSLARNAGY